MALSAYIAQTQRLLNDRAGNFYNTSDLTVYINDARRIIAAEGQCVRVLPPSTGSIASLTVASGGIGYVAPVVTISGPDGYGVGFINATATATMVGGVITGLTVTNAGTGYVNIPTVTITDSAGSGATAVATLTAFLTTIANQEVYTFAAASVFAAAANPGVASIIALQTVAVSWGSQKPVLVQYDWSGFQAYCRSINLASTNYPNVWAQYSQGVNGSIYMFPIPAETLQMDWDCYCLPVDLTSDTTPEAIPYPWTRPIAHYAAYIAYQSAQRRDDASYQQSEYKRRMAEARSVSSTAVSPDFYPGIE